MEQNKDQETQRREWRERQQRSRKRRAANTPRTPEWRDIIDGIKQRYEAQRPAVPPPRQVGWWIGKSTSEIKERLIRENPQLAKFFEKKKPEGLTPEET